MYILQFAFIFTLLELSNAHNAEVEAPWKIQRHEAHSFLTSPTRNRRSDPRCNTDEVYCENNKDSCMVHNEQSREYFCMGNTCTSTQACYLSTPCPAHYILGCSDNQCLSFPCHNGATCHDTSTGFTCQCVPGWNPADYCKTEKNECASNPCQNGGVCTDKFNDYSCSCHPGYTGKICQTDINECASFPCQNSGTCTDHLNKYSCSCVPGYTDSSCQTDLNECQSVPCLNGGSCNDLLNAFACDCTSRYEGSVCEKDCRPGPADIVFVVDTSDSLQNDVNKSIDFIVRFISKVPIGRNDFQIGVIAYNYNSTVLFDLDDYTSASDMNAVLTTIKGKEAATYTAIALQQAHEMLTTFSMGSRRTTSYIVLLHDGLSTDRNNAFAEAKIINAMGIRILSVGIGQSIAHREMLTISNSQYYTFSPHHLDDMYNQILKETVHSDCADCLLEEETQIVMLLDNNKNQTIENYNDRLAATRNIIEKVLTYNPHTKIGMYSYSEEPDLVFSLSWSADKDNRIAAALQINIDNHISTSNTSHALQHVRLDKQFSAFRKIVVIVSNGMWTDMDEIKKEVSYSKQDGIEVVGVIAGEDSVMENYQAVLNDPSQVFYTDDGNFKALESLATMTKYYSCDDNIFSKRQ
ncbi:Protein eyes shut homolog,Fibropellin-3,Protein crumbs homolog 2,Protein crumbs homolog 1,Neurogenic locus Notch protein,Neurogenic locus notch homolog protein 3,Sushi, von Willebrand factor type A, EGF and pentraxin domain-containing protein 1,Neurogenic locus notch homolog protein 4,Fibropellin-1,Neurogenic locus notch homolog protein 2,Neurogenic locus notch homolog protein 1 [Mytilus coruscus]|uniref:COL6A n=1 Tax=Mytilus coruscus TaxID=42192 RepID=A0A6J8ADM5_MYTCO|nr:Protein eyes shut homolog,Fibropellin-3,Protein crumbs homolog 2,Protein crumbs homolog 1,Neurogenic locus Notch protein,Neurogenic locus notch homolog protein 3,Sushi, von Willebrand factor type A, EGF and pentraxin domain-containing protein 1,Neurogenic locus notch homolog protein 4,Fibropellin-1,Neurogenic locus notch homolog protein 2,Neurogenic locus notch homolog protein 1 [Mytilus coruscus]